MKKTLLLVFTLLFAVSAWAGTPGTTLVVDGENVAFTWDQAYGTFTGAVDVNGHPYNTDGGFFLLKLYDANDELVKFADVFEAFKIGAIDYADGPSNRLRADFLGEEFGGIKGTRVLRDNAVYGGTLRGTDLNGALLYAVMFDSDGELFDGGTTTPMGTVGFVFPGTGSIDIDWTYKKKETVTGPYKVVIEFHHPFRDAAGDPDAQFRLYSEFESMIPIATAEFELNVYNETQDVYYETIQAAIDAAIADDVIVVAAGTYPETLTFDKSLTILGPNHEISPNSNPGRVDEAILKPQGLADAFIADADDITIAIKGITVDMDETDSPARFVTMTDRNIDNDLPGGGKLNGNHENVEWVFVKNIFKNGKAIGGFGNALWFFDHTVSVDLTFNDNHFYGNQPSNGVMVFDWPNGTTTNNIDIQNNVWKNNGSWALNLNCVHGTIANNVFKNDDFTPWPGGAAWENVNQRGIVVANQNNDLVIENNTFTELAMAAVYLFAPPNDRNSHFRGELDVLGNTFTENEYAIIAGRTAVADPMYQAVIEDVVVENNKFEDNVEIAIDNRTDETLDAKCNWWGQSTGPEVGQVEGNVDVDPWLLNENIKDPICGYDSNILVNGIPQADTTPQEVIDGANDGDIITFRKFFPGNLIMPSDKELTIEYDLSPNEVL